MTPFPRESWIVLGILVVIVLIAILGVYIPESRKLEAFCTEMVSQQRSLEDNAAKASVVLNMVRQVQAMKAQYRHFDRRLPKQIELGGFLREITTDSSQDNLQSLAIEPGNPERADLFHTLPIIMRFQGSYLGLANFLERIDKMQRLTRVQRLRILRPPAGQELEIEVQLNIYFTES